MDKQVGMSCVIATALWVLSLAVWGVAWAFDHEHLGRLSIIICGAAATTTVRCYFIEQYAKFKAAMVVTRAVQSEQIRSLR